MWPENWAAYLLFLDIQTQWVYSGMGTVTGMNYAGVASMIEAQSLRKELLLDIRFVEHGCLSIWREQQG